MKTKIFLIFITFTLSTISIQAQSDIFDKFSDNDDVTIVYISKNLLSMAPQMDMGGTDIKNLANKLDQIEIYSTEKASVAKTMKLEANKLVKDKSYEVMMKIKDKGENITFYSRKNNNIIKELIMVTNEANECTIIRILGNFTPDDIKKITDGKK